MIVLKNCNAFLTSEGVFKKKDLVIEDGKFSTIDDPNDNKADNQHIDVKGLYVTPGLVEPHCHVGLLEHGVGWAGSDENEDNDPIQDACHVLDGINMRDQSFNDFRKSGITTVGVFPGNNSLVAGYGAALKCKGHIVDDALIQSDIGLKVSLGSGVKTHFKEKKKAPLTRMGMMALLNQFVIDSKAKQNNKSVVSGQIPVIINCERLDDIYSAIRFSEKHQLKVKLVGLADFEDAKDMLIEKKIPFALGPIMGYATLKETRNRDRYRKITSEAMVSGALTTSHPSVNGRYASLQGSIMYQNGLDIPSVLKSLTINSAQFLGLDERLGSIAIGKDADLVIWDGHPLELSSKVIATMIDGEFVYKDGEL